MNCNPSARGAIFCALAGSIFFAALAFGILFSPAQEYFGSDIYNFYFHRLTEGRFDLPVRLLRYEGHYSEDGTGVLYHGVAPLLTRVLLAPFVALQTFPVAAFSVWLWAAIGTAFYHLALFQVFNRFVAPDAQSAGYFWPWLIGLSIWFGGPGVLLCANISLYHEPISFAYAVMAVSVFVMVRCIFFGLAFSRVLLLLSLLAGAALHARPNVAVGLYLGVIGAICLALWFHRSKALFPAIAAMLILLVSGVAFLKINEARFGSAAVAHGSFGTEDGSAKLQYGTVYWGYEAADSRRAQAFTEHGTFHPWRVLPNAVLYVFDVPERIVGPAAAQRIDDLHAQVTENISGYGRIEAPRMGLIFLWPIWILILVAGLLFGKPRIWSGVRAWPLLVSAGSAALLMLSYPTVTLRYRVDLWPVVIVLCLLCVPGVLNCIGDAAINGIGRAAILAVAVVGMMMSVATAHRYSKEFQTHPSGFFRHWDKLTCEDIVRTKGFAQNKVQSLCADPEMIN